MVGENLLLFVGAGNVDRLSRPAQIRACFLIDFRKHCAATVCMLAMDEFASQVPPATGYGGRGSGQLHRNCWSTIVRCRWHVSSQPTAYEIERHEQTRTLVSL